MKLLSDTIQLDTSGHGDIIDLTAQVEAFLASNSVNEGQLTLFNPGSTAAITTLEFESGAIRDLNDALDRIAPVGPTYHHDARWGDGNGFSHLRSALLGPSFVVPVVEGRAALGTWQQIIFVECDNRPRERRIVLSFVGE